MWICLIVFWDQARYIAFLFNYLATWPIGSGLYIIRNEKMHVCMNLRLMTN